MSRRREQRGEESEEEGGNYYRPLDGNRNGAKGAKYVYNQALNVYVKLKKEEVEAVDLVKLHTQVDTAVRGLRSPGQKILKYSGDEDLRQWTWNLEALASSASLQAAHCILEKDREDAVKEAMKRYDDLNNSLLDMDSSLIPTHQRGTLVDDEQQVDEDHEEELWRLRAEWYYYQAEKYYELVMLTLSTEMQVEFERIVREDVTYSPCN